MLSAQGLLNKRPGDRLSWPQLLEHPFVRETEAETEARQAALVDAQATAADSRAWKGEDGAVAGAPFATFENLRNIQRTLLPPLVMSSACRIVKMRSQLL